MEKRSRFADSVPGNETKPAKNGKKILLSPPVNKVPRKIPNDGKRGWLKGKEERAESYDANEENNIISVIYTIHEWTRCIASGKI